MTNNYSWFGSTWRLFPAFSERQLNIVSGVEVVTAKLIHLLLIDKGDDPFHPELGFAPGIFEPKSSRSATKFTEDLAQAIQQWDVISPLGIKSFVLGTSDLPGSSQVLINLTFIPISEYQRHTLTFDYYSYQRLETSVDDFIASLRLDGAAVTFFA